ncbi:MAG: type II toxin-antitoxin system Phd/YefM family antitoxin [Coriobacteriaceae bacterium]|nr:type II toxin-antitoxin system Phd/YefM family antitoxin [Coriobacteriaceae bacterium]
MAAFTIGLAEAKKNFSKLTSEVNRTGKPVTVLKNNKPWVIICPASMAGVIQEDAVVDVMEEVSYAFVSLDGSRGDE